eukprot:1158006-Pelagomonas_calceolata.AAC.30
MHHHCPATAHLVLLFLSSFLHSLNTTDQNDTYAMLPTHMALTLKTTNPLSPFPLLTRAFLERWIRGFARQASKEALRNQPDLFCIPAPAPQPQPQQPQQPPPSKKLKPGANPQPPQLPQGTMELDADPNPH